MKVKRYLFCTCIYLIIIFSFCSCLKLKRTSINSNPTSQTGEKIDDDYPIIEFKVTQDAFPTYWKESPINVSAKDLDHSNIDAAKTTINKAYKKYPKEFLKNTLRHVYVLKDIKCYDTPYGSTFSDEVIYVGYFWSEYTEKLFHHEMLHILG